MEPQKFTINGKIYVLADELKEMKYSNFMIRLRTTRHLVKDFNIKEEYYAYGVVKEGTFKEQSEQCRQSKLFLRMKWVKTRLPEDDSYNYEEWVKARNEKKDPRVVLKDREKPMPLLIIDEEEAFHDKDGKCLAIEMRGERSADKCFFRVNDVANAFGISDLYSTIIRSNTSYIEGEDYKKIIRKVSETIRNREDEKGRYIKELFLTYTGLLRVLFSTRNGLTRPFTYWATQVLFTAQLGEEKEKIDLCADILKTDYHIVKSVLSRSTSPFPCIYLIELGSPEDLKIDAPSGTIIYKYGRTNHMTRRMYEHTRTFGRNISMTRFSLIDDKFCSKAETEIRSYFDKKKCIVKYENHDEIVALNRDTLKETVTEYEDIRQKYAGKYAEIALKLEHDLDTINSHKDILKDKSEIIEAERKSSKLKDEIIESERKSGKLKDEIIEAERKASKLKDKKIKRLEEALAAKN